MTNPQVIMDNPAIKRYGRPHIQTVPSPIEKFPRRYWHFTATTWESPKGKERNQRAQEWVDKHNREFWEQAP